MWFILDKKYNAVGVLDNRSEDDRPYLNDLHDAKLENGYRTLQFDIPSNHPKASLLELDGYVIYEDNRGGLELFRIKDMDTEHGDKMVKTVKCEMQATSDLMSEIVRPTQFTSATAEQIMSVILAGTGWELGVCEYAGVISTEIGDYPTALRALLDIVTLFDMEIEFKVEFNGIEITKRVVNIKKQLGEETNVIVEYEHNMRGMRKNETSLQPLYTALIGVGKEVNGTYMKFDGLNSSPPAGYEHVADYIGSISAREEWGLNGKHIFGVYINTEAQSVGELYETTLAELKKVSRPRVTYEADMVMLEDLTGYEYSRMSIGDTIMVKDTTAEPPLYLNARILQKSVSDTDKTRGQVLIGEFVLLNVKPIAAIQQLQRKIDLREQEWDQAAEDARAAMELAEGVSYRTEIRSTKGTIFRNGDINTVLVATLYKGMEDISEYILASAFVWRKFDKDGIEDIAWFNSHQGIGRSVAITNAEVTERSTFTVGIDDDYLT